MYYKDRSESFRRFSKKIRFQVLLFTLLFSVSYAQQAKQEPSPFDKAFYDIYMNTASKDLPLALKRADSLGKASETDLHRLRALMLCSEVFKRMDNTDSSIHYIEKAAVIARKLKDYDWLARIYGSLSTQHREMGLLKQGRKYLDSSLYISDRISDMAKVNQYKGLAYQEMGYYDQAEEKYENAIAAFGQAGSFFLKLRESPSRHYFLAQNEERIGESYSRLKEYRKAAQHYQKAIPLDSAATPENTPLRGIIYNGLGYAHMALKEYPDAEKALKKALDIAETSNYTSLRASVFHNLSQFYLLTGDEDLYKDYNKKYEEILVKQASDNQKYIDNLLDETLRLKEAAQRSSRWILYTSLAVFTILLVILFFWIGKQRRDYRKFKNIIEGLKNRDLPNHHHEAKEEQPPVQTAASGEQQERELISEPMKAELLAKLEAFENSKMFTESNMSIAVLASKLNTNTKYLSHIINRNRDRDFNTYINELRVNYLIEKMKEDSRYLDYKLSYLAKETGFSSHSQFATVFKNITGLPPSTFVSYLKKNREKVG